MTDPPKTTVSRIARMSSAPAPLLFAAAFGLVALIAMLDALTGTEISFSIFYLVPVSLASGLVSRRAGWAISVFSAGAWGYLEIAMGPGWSADWIPLWNTAVRLAFFLLVTELMNRLRTAHSNERLLSRTDTLTGIANVRVFLEQAESCLKLSRRNGAPFTVAYVDLDHFKHVNDEFGHAEGDRLLQVVAGIIEDGLRATDLVARLGGDEFAILMPETAAGPAGVSLQRIAKRLEKDVGDRWSVGATFGAVTFEQPPADVEFAVRQADALMYRGKDEGRGRILQVIWPSAEDELGDDQ